MPKRRLGYGEVATEAAAAPSARGRTSQASSPQKKASSNKSTARRQPRRKTAEILVKLSDSCNLHAKRCHGDRSASEVAGEDQDERIPTACQKDLQNLQNLLPQIELKFQPPRPGEKGPSADDVVHLCAFYNSTIQSLYCPHAPRLFEQGKSVDAVLERVVFLLRHAISPAVVYATKREEDGGSNPESSSSSSKSGGEQAIDTISRTISHFLSFLEDPTIRSYIFTDLVDLLDDTFFLLEAKALLPIKIDLFGECREHLAVQTDCSLDIRGWEEVWNLQSVVFTILDDYSSYLRGKRFESMSTTSKEVLPPDNQRLVSGCVDWKFGTTDARLRDYLLSRILPLINVILCAGYHPSTVYKALIYKSKLSAANLLKTICSDWEMVAPNQCTFIECSMMIGHALHSTLIASGKHSTRLSAALMDLMVKAIFNPPYLASYPQQFGGRDIMLPVLLDCIILIEHKDPSERLHLDAVVLMATHFLLVERGRDLASAAAHAISGGIVNSLLKLLADARISNIVSAILAILMEEVLSCSDWNFICQGILDTQGKVATHAFMTSPPAEKGGKTKSLSKGGKRKRELAISPVIGLNIPSTLPHSIQSRNQVSTSTSPKITGNVSWIEQLGDAILRTLKAAQKVFDSTEKSSVEDLLINCQEILSMLRLFGRIVDQQVMSGIDSGTPNAFQQVFHLLIIGAQTISQLISVDDPDCCQVVIDIALSLHFLCGRLSFNSSAPHPLLETITTFLDKACQNAKPWMNERSFSISALNSYCQIKFDLGKGGMWSSDTSILDRLLQESFVSCNLKFASMTSLEGIFALPFGMRCCILLSLRPGSFEMNWTSFASDARKKGADSSEFSAASTMIYLLPFFMSPIKPVSLPSESTMGELSPGVLAAISELIMPASEHLKETGQDHLAVALLHSVCALQSIVRNPDASLISGKGDFFDALKVIQTLSLPILRSDFSLESSSLDLELDTNLKKASLDLELDTNLKKASRSLVTSILPDHPNILVRKLRWLCLIESGITLSSVEIREHGWAQSQSNVETISTKTRGESSVASPLMWLLQTAFTESDRSFRDRACQYIWELIFSESTSFLLTHYCEADAIGLAGHEFSRQQQSYELESRAELLVSTFFRDVDKLLQQSVGLSDSQLSFTMANSASASSSKQPKNEQIGTIERTAVELLASLCHHADVRTLIGRFTFEKALQRLVRLWAKGHFEASNDFSFSSVEALAFAEFRLINMEVSKHSLWWESLPHLTATTISDTLLLTCNESKEKQLIKLQRFVVTGVTGGIHEPLPSKRALVWVQEYFEDILPSVIATFVEEQSRDLLQLLPAFRRFLDEGIRRIRDKSSEGIRLVGSSNEPSKWKNKALLISRRDLDKQTRKLCSEDGILNRLLPLLFLRLDPSGLTFFLKNIMNEVSCKSLVEKRGQSILKELVSELGNGPESVGPAKLAIRFAAIARTADKPGGSSQLEKAKSATGDIKFGKDWVTANFMFLLVTVVQSKWKARTIGDRLHAVRCLHEMLDFLTAEESPQYFTQIMSTVNASILETDLSNWAEEEQRVEAAMLRLFAVRSLSKLIHMVVEVQVDTISSNLTTVVVSLIPVVADEIDLGDQSDAVSHMVESRNLAVSLLKFLTDGKFGLSLAPYFREIPFLPQSPQLDEVHRNLRSNGIDFDNLAILSSSGATQQAGMGTATLTEVSTTTGDLGTPDTERLLALQKRLILICGLLDHESTSVRKVSLEHLTDVLRGNRDTFRHLLLNESQLSGKRFLTATLRDAAGFPKWSSRGAVAPMVEGLLSRCASESDAEIKLCLASCVGEVGALSETLLGEIQIGNSMGDGAIESPLSSYKWRLEQPPWQSQSVKYELLLVTRHLVGALKAAPSATDQHKVAFAIQQLLFLLNSWAQQSDTQVKETTTDGKEAMTKWLKDKLEESGEYELIEPYFGADFKEKSTGHPSQKPPFARISASYHTWMANFCRWMIYGSKLSDQTPISWKQLFFACRTAVRTEVGLGIAEFIIPLLVLDRVCFGSSEDRLLVQQELIDVLRVDAAAFMDPSDKQRAVNTVFMTIDTLQVWLDREVDERSKGRSSIASSNRGRRNLVTKSLSQDASNSWSAEESIDRISDLLRKISPQLQAQAAARFGMNARALQYLEIAARAVTTLEIFETSIDDQKKVAAREGKRVLDTFSIPSNDASFNFELMKEILARLDDCATMVAIGRESLVFNPVAQLHDNIRQKEASGDYESALQDYERVLQASKMELDVEKRYIHGSLRCLLELGRYQSVLSQGLSSEDESKEASTFAVEAAMKLGRWDTVCRLLDDTSDGAFAGRAKEGYENLLGKAMLGLRRRDSGIVEQCIKLARESVMQNLSAVASESYSKCYIQVVKLQVLREVEDAIMVICNAGQKNGFDLDAIAYSTAIDGWSWKGRADLVTSRGALEILGARVGLARLISDPVLAGTLLLEAGHRARKSQRWSVAENLLSQSQIAIAQHGELGLKKSPKLLDLVYSSQVQLAKVKFACGDCNVALKVLGQPIVDRAVAEMLPRMEKPMELSRLAFNCENHLIQALSGTSDSSYENESDAVKRFSSRLLQLTRWASVVGLKSSSEILERFQLIQKLAPKWEKGHFYYGKFVDSILQARMAAMMSGLVGKDGANAIDEDDVRNDIILRDRISQSHAILSMRMYAAALRMDSKHVYQALPRLLSLWFDLVSVSRESSTAVQSSKQDPISILRQHQNQANTFMAGQLKEIPAVAFYTAMPQLISRVNHDDPEAAMVVKSILQRLLVKFPHQAMWSLAWVEGSKISDRKKIGLEIFMGAQKALAKNHRASSKLLEVSSNLFDYLRKTATCDAAPGRGNQIRIKAWQHPEVDLSEFLPPIQAALAISPTSMDHINAKDHFSRTIPKMRSFSERVRVMTSKAKPKRIKAYAVPGTYRKSSRQRHPQTSTANEDIGELHFLVKQEAKGDLRKDARVQDLNNVVNRLMASNSGESGTSSRQRRRLHLRTFAVTCLSEDIGILEWVPDTDSLRNLVMKSYNPQTSASCPRRRGNRLANFSDANLRSHYDMCQNKFFKEGNLSKAASLFEDHCMRPFPPLLWWWFQQNFHDPHAWYEARNRFTLSAAAWSAIGHVIGLGDRHSENILVDTKSGDCVHVDFDCIFDKGLNLPRPEVVPFRLTANMLDAFGPSGASGIYTDGLQTAMRTLRDNRDTLLSVLEPFLKDPVIDWKRHRNQQKTPGPASGVVHTDKQTQEAKRSIQVIDERLTGIYNLRNPNLKKYRRRDRSADQDDDYGHLVPLPVEGQVQRMISEATSTENLVQLYVGWMPWV